MSACWRSYDCGAWPSPTEKGTFTMNDNPLDCTDEEIDERWAYWEAAAKRLYEHLHTEHAGMKFQPASGTIGSARYGGADDAHTSTLSAPGDHADSRRVRASSLHSPGTAHRLRQDHRVLLDHRATTWNKAAGSPCAHSRPPRRTAHSKPPIKLAQVRHHRRRHRERSKQRERWRACRRRLRADPARQVAFRRFERDAFDLIVVDEAQHATSARIP